MSLKCLVLSERRQKKEYTYILGLLSYEVPENSQTGIK